jgi:peptidoglycan/LPS O-acetylase OafA/YrhL
MHTIGSRLDEHHGVGLGFDFLRVLLAMLVLLNHSFLLADGGYELLDAYHVNAIFDSVVPMFFALSGFLIAGSAQRLRLKDFLLNRALRIVPALAVEIVLSAVILGAFLTTYSLYAYYTDPRFATYFLNIVGYMHYELPGVFVNNPHPVQVNGSLWTVPWEIACYILMSAIIYFGLIRSDNRLTWFAVAFFVFYLCVGYFIEAHFGITGHMKDWTYAARSVTERILLKICGNHGLNLLLYFLCGSLFYNLRRYIPYSIYLVIGSAAVIAFANEIDGSVKHVIQAAAVSYIAAFVGVSNIPRLPIFKHGDYSYGIYLYGYVIQQTIVQLVGGRMSIVLHFLMAAVLSTAVAMFSWHTIERPILSLRKKFSFTARKTEAAEVEWEAMSADAIKSHPATNLSAELGGGAAGD